MTVRLRIEPDTLEKISKLVDESKYRSIHDFISLAIENQLQDELDEKSPYKTDNSETEKITKLSSKKEIFLSQSDYDLESIEPTKLDENEVEDIRDTLYGPGAGGLIWIFQNRFFPIKVALYSLAIILNNDKSNWTELESWKIHAGDVASSFSNELEAIGKIENAIGLPISEKKLDKKFARKKNKESKMLLKLESSKKRFSDQFIGRVVDKEDKVIFSGACFEMGLIHAKHIDAKWNVSITENGQKFLSFSNPIFDALSDKNQKEIKNNFSEDEKSFILNKIIPKFELENNIVNSILNIKEKEFKKQTIIDIFSREKLQYVEQFLTEHKLEDIQRKYYTYISNDFTEVNDKNTKSWIINRYLEMQVIGTIGRLIELGIIRRELVGREPHYYSNF